MIHPILKKIFSNDEFLENYNMRPLLQQYNDYLCKIGLSLKPKAKDKDNYVGLEIECFTELDDLEIMNLLVCFDLEKYVRFADDGSVEPDFGRDCEFRCLFPEKKLKECLKKLANVFKVGKFGINDTCGLHVHLDMRNRKVDACYNKLLKFQDVLYGLVKPERWTNDYCEHTDLSPNPHNRYVSINKQSYKRHKTIEIRLHHATLDMKQVEKWINLLVTILGSKRVPKITSKSDAVKWAKSEKKISGYVAKTFNAEWFKQKTKILASNQSDNDEYDNYDDDCIEDYA